MTFEKWLSRTGYFPVPRIKENYRLRGETNEFIQDRINEIKEEYAEWCSDNNVEPKYSNLHS